MDRGLEDRGVAPRRPRSSIIAARVSLHARMVSAVCTSNWRRRWEDFERRKIDEATAADLPPYVTLSQHRRGGRQPIGSRWSRARFDGDFLVSSGSAAAPACSLVFVQSPEGNTVVSSPSTLGGGATDKHLVYEGLSRVAADAVLAGANTVRGTGIVFSVWHPELVALRAQFVAARHPVQIVATRRGLDIERELFCNVPGIPVILLTSVAGLARMRPALGERPWIDTFVLQDGVDLDRAFAWLRGKGITRISCVGGLELATLLLDRGLVQDLYLTTGTRSGGMPGTQLLHDAIGPPVLRKAGTGPEAGVVFAHLAVASGRATGRPPRMRG